MFRYLKSFFVSEKKHVKEPSPEDELTKRLKPYERHLYKIQDIISWKDFNLSASSILLVHIAFWFISYFEWRFFGLFFSLLSAVLVHDVWVNYIWPEIKVKNKEEPYMGNTSSISSDTHQEGLLSLPEISKYATEMQSVVVMQYERLKHLRTTQPAIFCVVSSGVCLVLMGIGSVLSGMALLYVMCLAVLTLPGIYIHLVTPQQKEVITSVLQSISYVLLPPESSKNLDEYMPDDSQENLDILSKAGNNSNDLSTPSSESSMVDLIPCHDESSLDTGDSFTLPRIAGGDGSETDSEGEALSFKNSHFNGSSSGEDDASLVQDLSFPEVPAGGSITSALTGVFYKTFPSISGRLQFRAAGEGVVPAPTEEGDSDSSDFEIINEDS